VQKRNAVVTRYRKKIISVLRYSSRGRRRYRLSKKQRKLLNRLRFRRISPYLSLNKRFPIWFINATRFIKYRTISRHIIKNLKILQFLLRYFKFYTQILSKKRLLFFNCLVIALSTIITLLPKHKITNRLFIFLHLCYMHLSSFRYLYFQYNKDIYQSRFIRFNLLSKFVLFSLKKVSFIPTDGKVVLRYYGLHNRNFNARFILNYILVKLGQYFRLNDILNPLLNRFQRLPSVKGYRFIVSGRLTRRERAAFIVKSARSMPLSSYKYRIDSAADFKIMKFGVVGIKIHLLYTNTPPYYYFFEFRNKL